MNRLRTVWSDLAAAKRTGLVVYLTQGDPSPEATVEICQAVAAAGADIIELGVPFSDPNADGVVIQAAMQRALARGGGLDGSLGAVAELRRRGCQVPVVLFGYYNPIFVRGVDRFADQAAAAGVDAVLTVDLPIDELDELRQPLGRAGVDVVPLVAPTTGPDRLRALAGLDAPFIYYISMTGITGAEFRGAAGGAERIRAVRQASRAPVAVGFGIKTPDDARAVAAFADGIVVGSAVIQRIADAPPAGAARAAAALVADLRAALDDSSVPRDTA